MPDIEQQKQPKKDLNNISTDDLFSEWFARYCEEKANPEAPLRLPGGIEFYRDDALIVVGGMPGVGKSAYISSNSAVSLAQQGAHVLICSYEMRHSSSMERLLSCHSGKDNHGVLLNDIRARRVYR